MNERKNWENRTSEINMMGLCVIKMYYCAGFSGANVLLSSHVVVEDLLSQTRELGF